MGPDGALSSDEVNFLIYRYLLEAGFTHSAFVFGCESTVTKVNIDGNDVPIGALVSFIQKGFQFMELEANLTEDGTDVYAKYTSLSARDILTKDIKELKEAAKELKIRDMGEDSLPQATTAATPAAAPSSEATTAPVELASSAQRELSGHESEVLSMSWSEQANLLATGCADGTARIWNLSSGKSIECAANPTENDMITGVEWSSDGKTLAAGTASGTLLLWDAHGSSKHAVPNPASAAILALQWSKTGIYLATGSADGSVTVWNTSSGTHRQQWTIPGGAPVYDVHWLDDNELAAAGEDGCVAMFRVGKDQPIRASKEHGARMEEGAGGTGGGNYPGASGSTETVNMVRWSPKGTILASASNDMTVGLWKKDPNAAPKLLSGHKREVSYVAWATGEHAGQGLLASGSGDGSVRLWGTNSSSDKCCVGVLDRHEEGITSLAWSPDGALLVTGDGDGNVTIWMVSPGSGIGGRMLYTLRGPGAVVDVQWLNGGESIAVAFGGSSALTVAQLPPVRQSG